MTRVDPTFMQQILDVPKRKRETDIQHHRKVDDLWLVLQQRNGERFAIRRG